MSYPLLLDEMFSGFIAEQLRAAGPDVLAVVTDPALVTLSDDASRPRARVRVAVGGLIEGRPGRSRPA